MYNINVPAVENAPRSKALLDKVFARLEAVDVNALSDLELKDFLEVVQKCQFLESYGKMPGFGFGGCGLAPFPSGNTESKPDDTVE